MVNLLDESAIDGSTIEKRREQRKEQLERFLWSLDDDGRKGIAGMVNQWSPETGVRVVPASQSVYDLNSKTKKLRHYEEQHTFEVDPIIKRTPQQRLDSLVKRLVGTQPEQIEPVLKDIEAEYWKAGAPVTVEALRTVAAHFLNRTERKKH